MRHQILGLRDFVDKNGITRKTDSTFYKNGWGTSDLKEIFQNPEIFLSQIPESEHWNLYFTASLCAGKREFQQLKYIPFDIDHVDTEKTKDTLGIALNALGLDFTSTMSLCSGNGLQFFVEVPPVEDPGFFEDQRKYYKACCDRINKALREHDYRGSADTAVFDPARLMRFPNTLNKKPGKEDKKSYIIQSQSTPQKFTLKDAAGIPTIAKQEAIVKWPSPDTEAVLAECLNIVEMTENPNGVPEPLWYANASVIGRLEDGKAHWHRLSSLYAKYNRDEAETKLEQAIDSSNPRTCKSFANLPGSKCKGCKHNNTKLVSPILIKGPNYLPTKNTSFHTIGISATGQPTVGKPDYEGLLKWFEMNHPFVTQSEAEAVYEFTGTHFEKYPEGDIKSFAEASFRPHSMTAKTSEFTSKVKRNNTVRVKWFSETTESRLNLLNGNLNTQTGEFEAGHSKERGFNYVLPYKFDPAAKAPLFEKFLEEVTCGDTELRQLLLEFGGYALSNDPCNHHKALALLGEGRNGKSVFVQILQSLAENGYSSVSLEDLSNPQFSAMLEGKLFNCFGEGSTYIKNTNQFKELVGGGSVNSKTVFEKPYTFINKAKIIFACNKMPTSSDTSHGFYSRFLVVPFNATFVEYEDGSDNKVMDVHLLPKLIEERPGIINLMLSAYRETKKRGNLIDPVASKAQLNQYKDETDNIRLWVNENLEVNKNEKDKLTCAEMYQSYKDFCDDNEVKPDSGPRFFARLHNTVFGNKDRSTRKSIDGKQHRALWGVKRKVDLDY